MRFFWTMEEALEHAEAYLLRPETDLYAALHAEFSQVQVESAPTVLQLELLKNLHCSLHNYEKLSRSEAACRIEALYSSELMAGEARKPRPVWLSGQGMIDGTC